MTIDVRKSEAKETMKIFVNLGYFYLGFRKVDKEHVKLIFRDPIVPEENNITDIQFHEGDFVENRDGKIGYISSICHCDECKKRGFFEPTITYSDGTTDYISNYSVKTIPSDYKQIGMWRKVMDFENYCKMLESNLNEKWKEIHILEDKLSSLEEIIRSANNKLEDYYNQQKNNDYFSDSGKRLICRVIENCQKIVNDTFKSEGE